MLIGEPQASEYDWRFSVLGFRTRVTWLFWAVSAALGYGWAMSVQRHFEYREIPCNLALILVVWVAMTFVSILVHELGHALAFRYFGIESEIVLYQMGGLAIPGAGMLWSRKGRKTHLSHVDNIIISAAGPGIQLLLAAVVGITAVLCGVYESEFAWIGKYFGIPMAYSSNPFVFASITFLVKASIWWALINLLPIYPLDGGRIAQHLIGIFRRSSGLTEAYTLGAIVASLGAFWFFTHASPLNGLFFASMAASNFQALQASNGPRIW